MAWRCTFGMRLVLRMARSSPVGTRREPLVPTNCCMRNPPGTTAHHMRHGVGALPEFWRPSHPRAIPQSLRSHHRNGALGALSVRRPRPGNGAWLKKEPEHAAPVPCQGYLRMADNYTRGVLWTPWPGMYSKRGGGGSETQKFVYQKGPKSIFPFANSIFSHNGIWIQGVTPAPPAIASPSHTALPLAPLPGDHSSGKRWPVELYPA